MGAENPTRLHFLVQRTFYPAKADTRGDIRLMIEPAVQREYVYATLSIASG